jgi:hypothetical protein
MSFLYRAVGKGKGGCFFFGYKKTGIKEDGLYVIDCHSSSSSFLLPFGYRLIFHLLI